MNEYTVEILATVRAGSYESARLEGARLARVVRGSGVVDAVLSDVREDDEEPARAAGEGDT